MAKAPDGNGGLYRALATSGALAAMVSEGIQCLDCYCVDNILARVGDPLFVGCCYSQHAQVGLVCKYLCVYVCRGGGGAVNGRGASRHLRLHLQGPLPHSARPPTLLGFNRLSAHLRPSLSLCLTEGGRACGGQGKP